MATVPLTARFRGARRVRVVWTGPLASGAFTSTSLYAVTNTDGQGFAPITVVAVFAISGSPNELELAVNVDFTDGAAYSIGFTAVPCADLSNFTGTLAALVGLDLTTIPNQEPETSDTPLLLYGRDLLHNGQDFVQAPNGDLMTVSGRVNYEGAIVRREMSQGLTWDQSYSPQAEQFVDAPAALQTPFAGRLVAQAKADDRTSQATVQIVVNPNDLSEFYFELTVVPVDQLSPITKNFLPPGAATST